MNIAIFGCGTYGIRAMHCIEENSGLTEDKILCFIDNNSSLWNTIFYDRPVYAPDQLKRLDFDKIVITPVGYRMEIHHQLRLMGVSEDKMMFFPDYESFVLTKGVYISRYGKEKFTPEINAFHTSGSIVVYTGIFGDYDELRDPDYTGEGIDYVCFTNQQSLSSKIWNIRFVEDRNDNNLLGKICKFFPDRFFPQYEVSVWVDGKVHIKNDIRKYIEVYGKDQPVLCFPHYARRCIYDEAFACMSLHPDMKSILLDQITAYHSEGYPVNNGLYELSCIVRKHNEEKVKKLMQNWMDEVLCYSRRDQISFPYVCKKNNFTPDISDLDVRSNHWIERLPHKPK